MKKEYGIAILVGFLFLVTQATSPNSPLRVNSRISAAFQESASDQFVLFASSSGDAEDDGSNDELALAPLPVSFAEVQPYVDQPSEFSIDRTASIHFKTPLYILQSDFRI